MDSITKRKLKTEEILLLLRKAFGDKSEINSINELEDGWFNAIYLINLKNGEDVVLKVSPSSDVKILAYEERIMETEVKVMKLLQENYGLPVPKIYYYDNSKEIIDSEFYFMEKVEGIPYNQIKEELAMENRKKIEIQIGSLNKKINEIKNDEFGNFVLQDRRSKSWKEAFLDMVGLLLKDGQHIQVKLPRSYEYIMDLFKSNESAFDSVKEACLVHWDLHDGNIFVDKEKCEVTGIIDFERAFWGDPLIEFYFGEFTDKDSFIEGYGVDIRLEDTGLLRRILYNIYLDLIMVIECKYRKVEDLNHINWTVSALEKDIQILEKRINKG